MASLIPPKRPARPGRPKLSLPMSTFFHAKPVSSPNQEREHSCERSETRTDDATIMPFRSQEALNENPGDYMDELQRVVQRMHIPDDARESNGGPNRLSLSSLEASDLSSSDTSPNKRASWNSNNYFCHTDAPEMRTSASEPGYSRSEPMVLEGNLEVLESLGEGASGEVAKARVKSTGLIVARKVRLASHPDHCDVARSYHPSPAPPRAECEPNLPERVHCGVLWRIL